MPLNLKIGRLKLTEFSVRDPRFAMRALVWTLALLNVVAAVFAFSPLGGGSGESLRAEEAELRARMTQLERRVQTSKGLLDKVEAAKRAGDDFMQKYIIDARVSASTIGEELNRTAKAAGIRPLASQVQQEPIEGSDTLFMAQITAGYEGTYAGLKKFVELLDKSERFLIVDSMILTSPPTQAGQTISVNLKMDAFVRSGPGAKL
jgi:hypothetical protein